jgi:HKD family nuclease
MTLAPGLYEQLISAVLDSGVTEAQLSSLLAETRKLDPGDSHEYLAKHVAIRVSQALRSLPEDGRLEKQVELSNQLIDLLISRVPDKLDADEARIKRAELLLAILRRPTQRPDTPLSISCLMTGTRQDPSLVSQLQKEIATADNVDVLCSFIKWSGVRILGDSLRELGTNGRPLRVITTSYMGATDFKAIEFLREIPGASLKVSYDTRRTRLHAKAYIIRRATGFGVAYIGSSNISQAALTDGLEECKNQPTRVPAFVGQSVRDVRNILERP